MSQNVFTGTFYTTYEIVNWAVFTTFKMSLDNIQKWLFDFKVLKQTMIKLLKPIYDCDYVDAACQAAQYFNLELSTL